MIMDAGLDHAGHAASNCNTAGRDGAGFSGSTAPDGATLDTTDPRELAQDWITLWQSELSAMATDPEIHESWRTVTAFWAGTILSTLRGLARYSDTARHDDPAGRPGSPDAARAASAAAAPDARDVEIERLARHVVELERRLAELERGGDLPVHRRNRPGRKSKK